MWYRFPVCVAQIFTDWSAMPPAPGLPWASLILFHWVALCLPFTPRSNAQDVDLKQTESRLREVVRHLADSIGERNLAKPKELTEAANYLQKLLETSSYDVHRQTFQVHGVDCHNLVAEKIGSTSPKQILLVGAHYDSARGTPGANDNATGVAALTVIAERLKRAKLAKTVRFVLFANEEPPFFQRDGMMGSWVYARECRKRNDDIQLVLSLETMGFYTDEPNSQKYPPLIAHLYPSTGNFIGFVGNLSSRPSLDKVLKAFKQHSSFPAYGASLPGEIRGVGWSDHWSFWQEGYSGLMVTDTALFRYPHYHLPSDTFDKIDFERLSKVVDGLAKVIEQLANTNELENK
ncbi:MAG: M28 family peptidase [Pirellula sp.]